MAFPGSNTQRFPGHEIFLLAYRMHIPLCAWLGSDDYYIFFFHLLVVSLGVAALNLKKEDMPRLLRKQKEILFLFSHIFCVEDGMSSV